MLRKGRFKHQLFSSEQLSQQGRHLFEQWQVLKNILANFNLHPAEVAAVYFFVFCGHRRPTDFLGGKHSEAEAIKRSGQLQIGQLMVALPTWPALAKLSPDQNFLELVTTHHFRSIPHSVLKALSYWHQDLYPLILMNKIPSALEVLHLQAQHQRVVSLLEEAHHFSSMVETERDMLGFLVHDLIHADHFFHNSENAQLQSKFSKFLIRLLATQRIQQAVASDSVFEKEFFYLAADMNSVPLHLFKTLKAVLLGHFKRQHQIPANALLPNRLEEAWILDMKSLFFELDWPEAPIEAFLRLNSPVFSIDEDYLPLIKQLC